MNSGRRPLSCAVIGTGGFGRHYIRLISAHSNATLTAVASPSAVERDLNIDPSVRREHDAEKLLQDPAIEAVVIATPASTHEALAVRALLNGKHVLLEKPLATSFESGKRIIDAATESGKIFMLGHQYLYNDHIAALGRELRSGSMGTIRYVFAEQLYASKIRHDVGCFREAATHEIALIDHLLSPGKPASITASGLDLSGGRREDFATATIRYENGLFAHLVVSQFSPIKSRRTIFGGDKGMALFDDHAEHKVTLSFRPYPTAEKMSQHASFVIPAGEDRAVTIPDAREPLEREIDHFFECIANGVEPRSGVTHAMRVETVIDAVYRKMEIV